MGLCFGSVGGREKRASTSCMRQSVMMVDQIVTLTRTCRTFSIVSFPFYSSLSLPLSLSPLMSLCKYYCPEVQMAPLSITSPVTSPRVRRKSYGSSKIPTTRQTFSSESRLSWRLNPDSTGISQISSFSFFTGADPTQYALPKSTVLELTSSQWDRHVCHDSSFTLLAPGDLSLFYSYVDNTTAFANNLSYISWDDKVIMKGDDTSTLQAGQNRERCGLTS